MLKRRTKGAGNTASQCPERAPTSDSTKPYTEFEDALHSQNCDFDWSIWLDEKCIRRTAADLIPTLPRSHVHVGHGALLIGTTFICNSARLCIRERFT
jgi:hypothetical protein